MQIDIKSAKIELTPALREYTEKRIGGLRKFVKRFEKEGEVKFFIELAKTTEHHKNGEIFYSEANVEIDGELLRVESKAEDLRVAIDEIKNKLKRGLAEFKDKKVDEKVRGERPGKPN